MRIPQDNILGMQSPHPRSRSHDCAQYFIHYDTHQELIGCYLTALSTLIRLHCAFYL